MSTRIRAVFAACTFSLLAVGPAAHAGVALQAFSGGGLATSGTDQLYGWQFDVLVPIVVTDLGVLDFDLDGLVISHDVGIFDAASQALLASATIPDGTGAGLVDGFRYVGLASSLSLGVGSYVIVMTMPVGNLDYQSILNTSVTTAPEIRYVISQFGEGSSLAFPALPGAYDVGMFGPNFQFTAAAVSVPEPSTLALAGLAGVGGLVAVARRRKTGAAGTTDERINSR